LKEMDERRQQMIRQNRKNRDNDSLDIRSDRRRFPDRRPSPDGPPPFFHDHDSASLPNHK
jgi:hypothetical protein